jgi:hypothetical protein
MLQRLVDHLAAAVTSVDASRPVAKNKRSILSPFPQHRSALTDCVKLSNSGIADGKAVVIIGYTYNDMPLEPAIHAFEILASDKIGGRAEATFSGLCHRVHCCGKVIAWPIH